MVVWAAHPLLAVGGCGCDDSRGVCIAYVPYLRSVGYVLVRCDVVGVLLPVHVPCVVYWRRAVTAIVCAFAYVRATLDNLFVGVCILFSGCFLWPSLPAAQSKTVSWLPYCDRLGFVLCCVNACICDIFGRCLSSRHFPMKALLPCCL